MAEVSGSTFIVWQGENPDLTFPVTNDGTSTGTPVDLTGGKATLTYWKGNGTAVNADCTIATTTVSYELTHAISAALAPGYYSFQLLCKNSAGKIVMSKVGTIEIRESENPIAVN
jgi:hypothetical protein